jgi:hypothetical protein
MDEEDMGEFGIAPKQLLAKDDFKLPSYVHMGPGWNVSGAELLAAMPCSFSIVRKFLFCPHFILLYFV